jgi:hypothetical protein
MDQGIVMASTAPSGRKRRSEAMDRLPVKRSRTMRNNLALPPELRQMILRFVFQGEQLELQPSMCDLALLAPLFVCKGMHQEALPCLTQYCWLSVGLCRLSHLLKPTKREHEGVWADRDGTLIAATCQCSDFTTTILPLHNIERLALKIKDVQRPICTGRIFIRFPRLRYLAICRRADFLASEDMYTKAMDMGFFNFKAAVSPLRPQ